MKKESILRDKSYKFAIRIVRLAQFLQTDTREYLISKQILRSGTSVGAMVREAEYAQSKPDFVNKLSIALKEANETDYWLSLLKDTDYLENKLHKSLHDDCEELISMLVSSIKTTKSNSSTHTLHSSLITLH
ncbi:MAG: four helix bundle protein [Dysgonamonadaceae bacterium]|jgi:four helix bundle protein|nr:four helix bundle protein [Dysgonamonadaceae bacterium]